MDPPVASLDVRGGQRTGDDLAHIVTFLQTIPLLCKVFTQELLYELAHITYYQHFRSANTVVYQEGDSVVNFYLVLEGSLSEISGPNPDSPASRAHHPRQRSSRSKEMASACVVKLVPGDVFGFEDPTMSVENADFQGDTGTQEDFRYRHSRSRTHMTPPRQPHYRHSLSYPSSCPHPEQDPHTFQRQTTVLTENPCRLLFINWWQFRAIFYDRAYFKVASAREQFLQHVFQVFSERMSLLQASEVEMSPGGDFENGNHQQHLSNGYRKHTPERSLSARRRRRHHHRSNLSNTRLREDDEEEEEEDTDSHYCQRRPPALPTHQAWKDASNSPSSSSPAHRTPHSTNQKQPRVKYEEKKVTESPQKVVPSRSVPPPAQQEEPSMVELAPASGSTEVGEDAGGLSISELTPPSQENFNLIDSVTKLYHRLMAAYRPSGNGPPQWNGAELTSWLASIMRSEDRILLRGVWQYLLDEKILLPVVEGQSNSEVTEKRDLFFRFASQISQQPLPTNPAQGCDDETLTQIVRHLLKFAPDAVLSVILRRPSRERSTEELDFVYSEVMTLKAFSHLSNMVKRELASVLEVERHVDSVGKVVFRQGDKGTYWYIIQRGAVDVHIAGKGVVTSLKEGDEFGKLALINNAPRAATIIMKERLCQLLKVCKAEFDRILFDVEANTVRLKEHGKDVLLLARVDKSEKPTGEAANSSASSTASQNYSIIAGVGEKIVEYLLETKIAASKDFVALQNTMKETHPGEFKGDPVIRHLIYAYPIFMTTEELGVLLFTSFQAAAAPTQNADKPNKNMDNQRKSIIIFLWMWFWCLPHLFAEEDCLDEVIVKCLSHLDHQRASPEKNVLGKLLEHCRVAKHNLQMERATSKIKSSLKPTTSGSGTGSKAIGQTDPITMDVYLPNKTRRQITLAANSSVQSIVKTVLGESSTEKTQNSRLCEVKSSGEIVIFKNSDLGVYFRIGYNSLLFVANSNEMKELTPLPQQLSAMDSSANYLELQNVDEFAAVFCHYDWEQLMSIRTHELIFATFGRDTFGKISPNLDTMLRRFSRVQYWVVSEVVSAQNMHKRATLLRKIIKLAHILLQMKNIHTFIAIIMGLSHQAVTRLRNTWDKVPGKQQKMVKEFTALLDSSRNHRLLREKLDTLQPPYVPYMGLLMKDLAFVHERTQSLLEDNLVNFEKVQQVAKCIAQFEDARSVNSGPFMGPQKRDRNYEDMRHFIDNLACIEDQRRLTNLSLKLESKK